MNKVFTEIIKYTFWGIALTVALPSYMNFMLKRYENNLLMNQVILSQGLQPYRAKQVECSHISKDLLKIFKTELSFERTLAILTTHLKNHKLTYFSFSENSPQSISYIIQKIAVLEKEKESLRSSYDFCTKEAIYAGQTTAVLPGRFDDFNEATKDLYQELDRIKITKNNELKKLADKYSSIAMFGLSDMSYINLIFLEYGGVERMAYLETSKLVQIIDSTIDVLKANLAYDEARKMLVENFLNESIYAMTELYAQRLAR